MLDHAPDTHPIIVDEDDGGCTAVDARAPWVAVAAPTWEAVIPLILAPLLLVADDKFLYGTEPMLITGVAPPVDVIGDVADTEDTPPPVPVPEELQEIVPVAVCWQ